MLKTQPARALTVGLAALTTGLWLPLTAVSAREAEDGAARRQTPVEAPIVLAQSYWISEQELRLSVRQQGFTELRDIERTRWDNRPFYRLIANKGGNTLYLWVEPNTGRIVRTELVRGGRRGGYEDDDYEDRGPRRGGYERESVEERGGGYWIGIDTLRARVRAQGFSGLRDIHRTRWDNRPFYQLLGYKGGNLLVVWAEPSTGRIVRTELAR